jgi:hypothetical protein
MRSRTCCSGTTAAETQAKRLTTKKVIEVILVREQSRFKLATENFHFLRSNLQPAQKEDTLSGTLLYSVPATHFADSWSIQNRTNDRQTAQEANHRGKEVAEFDVCASGPPTIDRCGRLPEQIDEAKRLDNHAKERVAADHHEEAESEANAAAQLLALRKEAHLAQARPHIASVSTRLIARSTSHCLGCAQRQRDSNDKQDLCPRASAQRAVGAMTSPYVAQGQQRSVKEQHHAKHDEQRSNARQQHANLCARMCVIVSACVTKHHCASL